MRFPSPLFLFFLLLSFALVPVSEAIGLGHQYLDNRTLELHRGENYFFRLTLQNDEEQDVTVDVLIESDIARLVGGGVVTIPAKTYDRFVYFNITVPGDAELGARYPVRFTVAPAGSRGEGQVPFAIRYDRAFDVLVVGGGARVTVVPSDIEAVERPRRLSGWSVAIGLLFLLLLAGFLFLLWTRSGLISRRIAAWWARRKSRRSVRNRFAPPHERFQVKGGPLLSSLEDLAAALRAMDEATFKHHVTLHKNDFSQWVESALGLEEIARRMAKRRDRRSLLKLLDDELA